MKIRHDCMKLITDSWVLAQTWEQPPGRPSRDIEKKLVEFNEEITKLAKAITATQKKVKFTAGESAQQASDASYHLAELTWWRMAMEREVNLLSLLLKKAKRCEAGYLVA